ncbi:MAG: hypothetical protein ACFHWX_10340 [Bacteroidota bacterium]
MLFRLLTLFYLIAIPVFLQAQCAMCRTQVVNNVSHGETALAAGLNFGIMYLFFAPYILVGLVAFFWFRNAKVNERKRSITGRIDS